VKGNSKQIHMKDKTTRVNGKYERGRWGILPLTIRGAGQENGAKLTRKVN